MVLGYRGARGRRRRVRLEGRTLHARARDGAAAIPAVLAALDAHGVKAASVTLARPSLDDVYLRHAGRSFDRADAEHEAAGCRASGSERGAGCPAEVTLGVTTAIRQTWQVNLRYLRVLRRQPAYLGITLTQPIIWLLLFERCSRR